MTIAKEQGEAALQAMREMQATARASGNPTPNTDKLLALAERFLASPPGSAQPIGWTPEAAADFHAMRDYMEVNYPNDPANNWLFERSKEIAGLFAMYDDPQQADNGEWIFKPISLQNWRAARVMAGREFLQMGGAL